MPAPTSYRLDPDLKRRVSARAAAEGLTETSLVAQLLHEGLIAREFPGVVHRGGPSGRRAGIAGGPDLWEIVLAVRGAPGSGEAKVSAAASALGVPERMIRIALDAAATLADEVGAAIERNEVALGDAHRRAERRAALVDL